eukprot:9437598-Ditylum_brightwellii.AAC.1
MANAGEPGHIFAGWNQDLKTKDLIQIMGTYILDGLNPSPQITHKMRMQSVDKNIGTNVELKYKIFHHFFAVQNPITTPHPKDKCPNYKVDSFFNG